MSLRAWLRASLSGVVVAFLVGAAAPAAARADDSGQPDGVPPALRVSSSEVLVFDAIGIGDQVYTCAMTNGGYAWTLKEPDALLYVDYQVVGNHYAGPTWESYDGSKVKGMSVANAASPDPDSIPWLLLEAVAHEGDGAFSHISSIQRLDTTGGKAPATGCTADSAGAVTRVHYEAHYCMYEQQQ